MTFYRVEKPTSLMLTPVDHHVMISGREWVVLNGRLVPKTKRAVKQRLEMARLKAIRLYMQTHMGGSNGTD